MNLTARRLPGSPILWVLALCVLLRGVWAIAVQAEPIADFAFYYTRAVELTQGIGYQYQGHPTAFFPVGTSLLLAALFLVTGPSLLAAKILSIAAWCLATWLLFLVARAVSNERTALLAALLMATYPDFVVLSGLVASENLFLPLLLAAVLLLLPSAGQARSRLFVLFFAGVVIGAAVLVRSTAIIVLPLFVCALLFRLRHRWAYASAAAGALVVGIALTISPWIVRNQLVFGKPVLSTNGGISLWTGNNPAASGGFPLSIPQPRQDLSTVESEFANNAFFSHAAWSFFRDQPLAWIRLIPKKLSYLFGSVAADLSFWSWHRYVGGMEAIEFHPNLGSDKHADRAEYVKRELGPVESKMIGAYQRIAGGAQGVGIQLFLWVVGTLGLVQLARNSLAALLVLTVPVVWILFHITLGNGQPRYLLSVAPLMCIGLAHIVLRVTSLLRR